MKITTLAECTTGDRAKLNGIDDEQLSVQLFCMGCIPGETITIGKNSSVWRPNNDKCRR